MVAALFSWCGHKLYYFLLLFFFVPSHPDKLKQSAPSRIINVSSVVQRMGKLDLDNMRAEKSFSNARIYFNSKLANVMFTRELAQRLHGTGH